MKHAEPRKLDLQDLEDAIFLKPDGLVLQPRSTLLEHVKQWLRDHASYVADVDKHIDPSENLDGYYPLDEPAPTIHFLIVTDEVLEGLDKLRGLPPLPKRVASSSIQESTHRVKSAPSPSVGAGTPEGVAKLLCATGTIHGGCPVGNYGPPPAVYHPALAIFDHHLWHLDAPELEPKHAWLYRMHRFIETSLRHYDSEALCAQAVHSIMEEMFPSFKTEQSSARRGVNMRQCFLTSCRYL